MEYDVIEDDDLDRLVERVCDKIREGWLPLGGTMPSFWTTNDSDGFARVSWNYTQALTRREDEV